MSTSRFLSIVLCAVCLTCIVAAGNPGPTASDPAAVVGRGLAAITGISPEAATHLRELAKLFETPGADMIKDNIIGTKELVDIPDDELLATFAGIETAIELSNTGGDFSSPPVSCGDELYDLAAREMYRYMLDNDPDWWFESDYAVLQRQQLEQWEQQFSGDCRFGELEFLSEWHYTEKDYQRGIDFLKTACDCPNATLDTALQLYLAEMQLIRDAAGDNQEKLATELAVRETELTAILDRARSLEPANAWPDYFQAELCFRLDRDEEAIDCLRRGNARPGIEFPRPDIIRFAQELMLTDEPYGNAAVNGNVLEYQISLPTFDAKYMKGKVSECILQAGADEPGFELMNTIYRFGNHWSRSWPQCPIVSLYGINIMRLVLERYEQLLAEDAPVAIDQAKRLRGAITTMTGVHREYPGEMDVNAMFVFFAANSETGIPVYFYLDEALHARAVINDVIPILEQMEQVSFPLNTDHDWLKQYPPLRIEDIKAFHAGKFEWDSEAAE